MMRPVSVVLPPKAATDLNFSVAGSGNNRRLVLAWKDNSINETSFLVQKTVDGLNWVNVGTSQSPLTVPDSNTVGIRTLTDPASYRTDTALRYQVVAQNTIGYGGQFPSLTARSVSGQLVVGDPPSAPSAFTAVLQEGPQIRLAFTDNASNEVRFLVERSTDGGGFVSIVTLPAKNRTGSVTYTDDTVVAGAANASYSYRVTAVNAAGTSGYAVAAPVLVPATPAAPSAFTAVNGADGKGSNRTVILTWTDNSGNETGFTIQRATDASFTSGLSSANVGAGGTTLTQSGLSRNTQYWYRIRANNGAFVSSAWVFVTPQPIITNP